MNWIKKKKVISNLCTYSTSQSQLNLVSVAIKMWNRQSFSLHHFPTLCLHQLLDRWRHKPCATSCAYIHVYILGYIQKKNLNFFHCVKSRSIDLPLHWRVRTRLGYIIILRQMENRMENIFVFVYIITQRYIYTYIR